MKAVLVPELGGPEVLTLGEIEDPLPGPRQILVDIHAAALNRADLLQRRGKYPVPPGESPILGLECSGVVSATGPGVSKPRVGERVMALLGGGGYAEKAIVPASLAIPIPEGMSFEAAAAVPEAFLTAREALFTEGQLGKGERVLIHAGASGVGSAAIQLARLQGATVFSTASVAKRERLLSLGANRAIDYRAEDFAEVVSAATEKRGVEVVVDFIGARYAEGHLKCLAVGGRWVVVGLLGGAKIELDLSRLLFRRLQLRGLIMRSRSLADKERMTREFIEQSLPALADGRLKPVVDSVFPWTEVRDAHAKMEANANIGKIVLKIR